MQVTDVRVTIFLVVTKLHLISIPKLHLVSILQINIKNKSDKK